MIKVTLKQLKVNVLNDPKGENKNFAKNLCTVIKLSTLRYSNET